MTLEVFSSLNKSMITLTACHVCSFLCHCLVQMKTLHPAGEERAGADVFLHISLTALKPTSSHRSFCKHPLLSAKQRL